MRRDPTLTLALALALAVVLALATLPAAPALAGDGPLFMWRAEKDGAVIDLLGSIHAGDTSFYPLDARIDEAVAAADTVACEIDVTDPAVQMKVAVLAQQQGMYPADDSLKNHVSEATWQDLVTRLEGVVPPALLERMRPGLAATLVAQVAFTKAGLDMQSGVDLHIIGQAKTRGTPVVALETPEDQVALLFGPDAAIDALMLTESLADDTDEMLAMLDDLVVAWKAGDPEALERAYREDWLDLETMQRFHEELLLHRNHGMADRLRDRRGRWFVVVGALHLCGEEGVPALLANAGWQVEQVGAPALQR
ncbi:MAG: TraB/GumN family protein [Candidatus Krumholzibacteriia bacterium]